MRVVFVAALAMVACGSTAAQSGSTRMCDLSTVPTAPPTLPVVKGAPLPAPSTDPSELIADAAARSDAALAAYRASGCDPRDLKQIALSHIDGPLVTLESAVARADMIVVGEVRSLDPLDVWSPMRPGPISTAHVEVAQSLKGTPARSIDVKQYGGIALQPKGLVLGHMGAELILPGDEVVLILQQQNGAFWPIYPLGAVRVRGSSLDPTTTTPYEELAAGLRAMTRDQLLARIKELEAVR